MYITDKCITDPELILVKTKSPSGAHLNMIGRIPKMLPQGSHSNS